MQIIIIKKKYFKSQTSRVYISYTYTLKIVEKSNG